MVILVTGGDSGGQRNFAEAYAARHGDEGIRIAVVRRSGNALQSDPLVQTEERDMRVCMRPYGYAPQTPQTLDKHSEDGERSFCWKRTLFAEGTELPAVLQELNYKSNIFRAERRVIVIDNITDYLRACLQIDDYQAGMRQQLDAHIDRLFEAIHSYQGSLIAVTSEPGGAVLEEREVERLFRESLGLMNRRLAEASRFVYWVTAGIAVELKEQGYRF